MTTVPTDVDEAANLPVGTAHQHDRDAGDVANVDIAGLFEVVGMRCEVPGTPVDARQLGLEDRRIRIPTRR
jgi:hypothetical protein